MIVKICANKSLEDAKMCIDAGADIIGILVGQQHASTDFVDKTIAKEICSFAKGKCTISLVTHLTNADEIIDLTKFIGNDMIQLHSNIDENQVERIHFALPNIKLVRLIHMDKNGNMVSNISDMRYVDYYLMDSFNISTNQVGGTGITYDWKHSGEIIKSLDKPVFLAGGLTPENVQKAIAEAHPYGIDVNSGCKISGIKNAELVKLFVKNAKMN